MRAVMSGMRWATMMRCVKGFLDGIFCGIRVGNVIINSHGRKLCDIYQPRSTGRIHAEPS